jgi:hypothetical protein
MFSEEHTASGALTLAMVAARVRIRPAAAKGGSSCKEYFLADLLRKIGHHGYNDEHRTPKNIKGSKGVGKLKVIPRRSGKKNSPPPPDEFVQYKFPEKEELTPRSALGHLNRDILTGVRTLAGGSITSSTNSSSSNLMQ